MRLVVNLRQSGYVKKVSKVSKVVLDNGILEEVKGNAANEWHFLDEWLQFNSKHAVHLEILDSSAAELIRYVKQRRRDNLTYLRPLMRT